MAFNTAAFALWTILSSRAATANGRRLPSAFGMYVRRDGTPMSPLMQISEVSVKVCFVGRPRQSVHAGGSFALERPECFPEQIDADVVEECSEPLLLPLP